MTDADQKQRDHSSEFVCELPACDILMQLDNMLEGGMENVVIDLARALEGWGYSVAILVLGTTGEGAHKALRSGLRVCVFPYDEQAFSQELERSRPKVVFAHYSFQGVHLYKNLGIPFIQVLHNVYAWFNDAGKEMFAKAAEYTTLFVAVSEVVKEYSIEHLGVPSEKCVIIPNGIDLSRFTPEARRKAKHLREQLGFSENEFLFVAVASINRAKRILALVKSFRCIRELAPHVRLILLGYPYDTNYRDEILTYIDNNGLKDRVRYVGHSTTPELYYLMADAFVHAASIEGGQLVLLEALTANLPVVSTDVGFTRHFSPYPGIRMVDRSFPYAHASFINAETVYPTSELVADLAYAMLQTCQSGIQPNFPQEFIAAFDASRAYVRYEQLIAKILKRPPQTKPIAGWMELLPEPPNGPTASLVSGKEDFATNAIHSIAQYEAMVAERDTILAVKNAQIAERDTILAVKNAQIAECDTQLENVFQSISWKITSPFRTVVRIIRSINQEI
jgi:glycosyltransferase involved in cell wall biosynthesis